MAGLNPVRTLNAFLRPIFITIKSSLRPKLIPASTPDSVMSAPEQPSLDALINGTPRKQEGLEAIGRSLSNCLSGTNLRLSVPDLKSKIRGKVRDIYDSRDYLVLVATDRQIRGFVTGSTDTSLWTVYGKGVCNYCGNAPPNGLLKNQRLPENILTPTDNAADHDVPITPQQIVERGLMTQDEYDEVSTKALSLFEYGQVLPDASQELIAELAWRYTVNWRYH